ncbi:O-antigen ligase family protein [Ferdinandcohnia sp. Marseille-Q9671]
MDYSLDVTSSRRKTDVFITVLLFFIAIFLNHSNEMFGVNMSLADLFCFTLFVFLIVKNNLVVPTIPTIFFLLVSIIVLLTSTLFIPYKYMFYPEAIGIMSNYLKLVAIYLYFIIGYNVMCFFDIKSFIKWYTFFGIFIGGLGVLLTLFKIRIFSSLLFYGDFRFRGLLIDPNFYAVIQITTFVYISRSKEIQNKYKWLVFILILLAVIASGSKTGMITLFCYMIFRTFEYIFLLKKESVSLISQFFLIVLILIIAPYGLSVLQSISNEIASSMPSFARINLLLTNFSDAISENGSGRDTTWQVALQIIQLSPLLGIGIGTYSDIAFQLFKSDSIAHNTYLQVASEWGIPLAFTLFSYIFIMIGKATNLQKPNSETNMILRDIIIILLIGSMAISLNNARGLWLFLGALVASLTLERVKGTYKNPIK